MITQERLKELLDYDPETGIFTWKMNRGKCFKGTAAGSSWKGKYQRINIERNLRFSHSLAFLWMIGYIPSIVDHVNRDGNDNRWCNLREVTKDQNAQNKSLTLRNSSGYIGVYKCSTTGRWSSQIRVSGKVHFIGRFDSPLEAAIARDNIAKRLHGEFAVLNV